MKDFIKQLFCDHSIKEPFNKETFVSGRAVTIYRVRCKKCGKVWKL